MKLLSRAIALAMFPMTAMATTLTINGQDVSFQNGSGQTVSNFNNIQVVQDNGQVLIVTDPEVAVQYAAPDTDADQAANNFAPIFPLTVSRNYTVAAGTTAIGLVRATDADTGQYTVTIPDHTIESGNSGNLFDLSSAGTLSFLNSAVYNQSGNNVYYLEIEANDQHTDAGGTDLSKATRVFVRVEVSNGVPVNPNTPTFTSTSLNTSVASNFTGSLGTVAANDVDGDNVSYSLVGTNANLFSINSSTGVVSISSAINPASTTSYSFRVRATDDGNPVKFTETSNYSVTLTVSGGGSSSGGSSSGGSSSGGTGSCGATPTGWSISTFNWNGGPQFAAGLEGLSKKIAFRIDTGSNPSFAGRIKLTAISGSTTQPRQAWLSECPGQGSISTGYGGFYCGLGFTQDASIEFTQSSTVGSFFQCKLGTNKTLYLNVQNTQCNTGYPCDLTLSRKTNGQTP